MAIFFPPPPPFIGGAQPWAPQSLNPAIEAVPVNNPPFTYGGPIAEIAEIIALSQPNPWQYDYFGAPQPFTPSKLNPSITAVPVNNPPFTLGGPIAEIAEVIALSQPPIWPYVYIGADGGPYMPVVMGGPIGKLDNPPFLYGGPIASIAELTALAQPDPWTYNFLGASQPFTPSKLNPSITAVPVNNPPFDSRRILDLSVQIAIRSIPPIPDQVFYKQKVAARLSTSFGVILT